MMTLQRLLILTPALGALVCQEIWAQAPASPSGQLEDIVIRGEEKEGASAEKPEFDVPIDHYDSIRASLKPNESQFLIESPLIATWVRSRPDRLKIGSLLEPWNDALQEVSELNLPVSEHLASALGRKPSAKELKGTTWSLRLIDEEGKPIRRFDGEDLPPEQVVWDGLSDRGEWIRAGHAYSAVYNFSRSSSTTRTILGPAILFQGLVHREGDGTLIGIDSSVLFGAERQDKELSEAGKKLLRAAADWIRRRAYGYPILLRAYGQDVPKAQTQADAAGGYLMIELGLPAERISTAAAAAPASEQRVDLFIGIR